MNNFDFGLMQGVVIAISGECGQVVGRAEYPFSENQYLVRYKCADGRAVENWWPKSALTSA